MQTRIGNRSLGWDLLPPGSTQFEFEGKIYTGYREVSNALGRAMAEQLTLEN